MSDTLERVLRADRAGADATSKPAGKTGGAARRR